MNLFVIRREDGKFMTPLGSKRSYDSSLQNARVFTSRSSAESEKCSNESVVPLETILHID